MAKPNYIIRIDLSGLINQLLYLIDLTLIQDTHKIKRSLGAWLQASVDCNKRVCFKTNNDIIYVRPRVLFPLNRIIGIIIVLGVETDHVEVI